MDTWVASRRTARLVFLSVAGPWVQGSAFCFIYAVHPGLGFVYTLERREFLWLSPRTAFTWSSWTTPRTSQIEWLTRTMVRIVRLLHRACGHGLWWLREEQPGSFTVISRFAHTMCFASRDTFLQDLAPSYFSSWSEARLTAAQGVHRLVRSSSRAWRCDWFDPDAEAQHAAASAPVPRKTVFAAGGRLHGAPGPRCWWLHGQWPRSCTLTSQGLEYKARLSVSSAPVPWTAASAVVERIHSVR